MSVKEAILSVAKDKKVFKASDIQSRLPNYSRQYISSVVSEMAREGTLVKEGSGRWTTYALPEFQEYLGHRIHKRLLLKGLKEHEVMDDVMRVSTVLSRVPENVRSIFNYAFSEMLNNAIEHSESEHGEILIVEDGNRLRFVVSDYGIGVFRSVMQKRHLKSELESIQDLLKGKTTTAPQAHSGEGIFFTSKAADIFILDSFGLRLRIDNKVKDIFVEELTHEKKGTRVTFEIANHSRRHLNELFAKYQTDPEEPAFDKTEIKIKLYIMGTIYVSRSQARRILAGLEKFKTIILDFDSVPTIGQAFADEIFRVFKNSNPEIKLVPLNMNEGVEFMVKRAQAENNQT